jgi:hypothetical protein
VFRELLNQRNLNAIDLTDHHHLLKLDLVNAYSKSSTLIDQLEIMFLKTTIDHRIVTRLGHVHFADKEFLPTKI